MDFVVRNMLLFIGRHTGNDIFDVIVSGRVERNDDVEKMDIMGIFDQVKKYLHVLIVLGLHPTCQTRLQILDVQTAADIFEQIGHVGFIALIHRLPGVEVGQCPEHTTEQNGEAKATTENTAMKRLLVLVHENHRCLTRTSLFLAKALRILPVAKASSKELCLLQDGSAYPEACSEVFLAGHVLEMLFCFGVRDRSAQLNTDKV